MYIWHLFTVLLVSSICVTAVNGNPLVLLARLGLGLLTLGRRASRQRPGTTINAPNPSINTFYGGEFEGDIYLGGGRGMTRQNGHRGFGATGVLGRLRELNSLRGLGSLGGLNTAGELANAGGYGGADGNVGFNEGFGDMPLID